MKNNYLYRHGVTPAILLTVLSLGLSSCKKFVTTDTLKDNLLASKVFNNEATANNAIAGIYGTMKIAYSSLPENITVPAGLCADELQSTTASNNFQNNAILSTDILPWGSIYRAIYQCNAAIQALETSKLTNQSKNTLLGEAKFLRAFNYFYLVNLFGEVPLILNADVNASATAARNSVSDVNTQIKKDLFDAETLLPSVNGYAMGEKIRANKQASMAMLARFFTYVHDWPNAFKYSDALIQNDTFILDENLVDIFSKTSTEAILQIANNPTQAIDEISNYYPINTSILNVLTPSFVSAFEPNDKRKSQWVKSFDYMGTTVFYPFKYTSINPDPSEYYVVFRLAEMYLIRAEANAMQNNFALATADINVIRLKHGGLTTPLVEPSDISSCVDMILHERRVELFVEGGHRWLDLKRTGRVDVVIANEKPGKWKSFAVLWPIPFNDLQRNQSLRQNPGYQ